MWSGAWPGGEKPVTPLQLRVRRALVRGSAAAVAYGSLARDYLVALGSPPQSVCVATNTVDLERFVRRAAEARGVRRSAQDHLRPLETRVLYAGSLIRRKGVEELLRGFALACADAPSCALEVVGTGPLLHELQRLAAGLGVLPRVRFHGFLQGDEVARLAGRCGVFVCPSHRELWGLVINEAMACGLPVIASRNAGATSDLIVDGVNGFVVDPASPDDISAKLGVLVRDPERAREMGRRAAADVRERASLARSAEGFIAGIEIALGHRNAGVRRSRPAPSQPGARPRT